jgi:hypothetical protein
MGQGRKGAEAFPSPTVTLFDEDSLIMANIRVLAIIAFLVPLGSRAVAMSPQEIAADVKVCKAITDDKQRLKCFDSLFAEPSKPQNPPAGTQAYWSIDETKSPTDGSPQVVAANLVGDTVLILRCKEQTTEAAFSTQFNYLGYKSVDVQLRINDQNPIKEVWKASMNGRAAFAPDAIAFIQSLPDNGELSIKTTRSTDGKVKEGHFNLGAVSEVRNKIAKACDWADGSVDEPVGSIERQEGR